MAAQERGTDLAKPDSRRASERDGDEVVVLLEHAADDLLVHHRVHGGEVPDAAVAVDELAQRTPYFSFSPSLDPFLLVRASQLDIIHKHLTVIKFC